MASVVLVGLMGAGKTTIGQLLAQKTQLDLIDLDQKIVADAGKRIPDIFEEVGEIGFRQLETQALRESLAQNVILSTGGGVVTQAVNRMLLKNCAVPVVYLQADASVLYRRVCGDNNRPIAKNLNLQGFQDLAQKRADFYEEVSDLTIKTDGTTPDMVTAQIFSVYNFGEMNQLLS